MKRIVAIIAVLLFFLSLYYDMKVGTLPMLASHLDTQAVPTSGQATQAPFFEYQVQSGDTVLSIIQSYTGQAIPVSVETVVQDFIRLNQVEPTSIQIGQIYQFPTY